MLSRVRGGSGITADALDVEPIDTDGRRLTLVRHPTAHPSMVSRDLRFGHLTVRFDVLAASHRVTFGDDRGPCVHETVACDADGSPPVGGDRALPDEFSWQAQGWSVRFRSVFRGGPDAVDDAAASVAALAGDRQALIATFPGHEQAKTALSARRRADGIGWTSWHLYPGDDPHVVTTATVVAGPPALGRQM